MQFNKLSLLYDRTRTNRHLYTFVVLTRYLIAFAFIPSGLKKVLGQRFTQLSVDTPVGLFFEGLYQAGFYWNFLGWGQLAAAFLLMTQRFATLGALLFFIIISNIWVITISMHFAGTWVITSMMLLATIMLLVWDFHKLKYLFYPDNFSTHTAISNYPDHPIIWVITGFILFVISTGGLLIMEQLIYVDPLFSRVLLIVLFVTVACAVYLNEKRSLKMKRCGEKIKCDQSAAVYQ